ncbi:unnamed protein product [Effrenium voratum]|nr:unnamed protein product [Effrenium voratum]
MAPCGTPASAVNLAAAGSRSPSASSHRGYSQQHQQRVAVNAEGRFLAHWDEFVEHRREVQAKLEEAFEMASERREAGLRLARLCQQLDTKVERLARQAKEQSTHGEAFEERVSSQAKGVEACKEAVEVLRDKIQRQVQDLSSAIATSRSELSEDAERRHHGLQEAMRRGDRCLAEEFFRKLQESSEKLSSNLQVLEDALATFVRQTRVQLADLTDQVEAKSKEQLATLKAQATESSKLEAQLAATQEETAALASRADSTEGACGEQVRQLASLETRFAKMQEAFVRFEGKASAAEDAEQSRCHQLMEHLREAKEQTASAMVRLRSELTEAISVAMSSAREESREALQGLRAIESSVAADVQALREELRQSFTSAAERQQLLVSELRGELADSSEQSRSNGRELLALIEELQGQCMELRSEGRRAAEDVAARYRAETQVHLEDLKAQLGAVRVDFAEERKQSKASRDELTVLEESCGSLRRSLLEVSSSAGKAQGSADEAASECARLQSFVEGALTEIRRDVRAEGQQVLTLERQLAECKEELARQVDVRAEAMRCNSQLQRDASELGRRLDTLEHSQEESVSKSRDLRETSRSVSDRVAELEERLVRSSEQSDLALLSVRNEVARVAAAAQDLAPEVEQACRRLIAEEAQMQADKWAQTFQYHKQANCDALQGAVAEPRAEVRALRLALSEQEVESAARFDRLSGDLQRQDRAASSRMKQEMEEMTVGFEERVAAATASVRQAVQEQRQEVFKQLDPIMERLSEVTTSIQASRRAEAELGGHFERLLVTTEELCAGQEALSAQGADTAQSLNDLRSEIRNVGSSQETVVRQVQSPRSWRRQEEYASPQLSAKEGLRGATNFAEPSREPLRMPEEPVSRDAALHARSSHSSPEKPTPRVDVSSAFSRLGELRRRLGSPAHQAHQEVVEPVAGVRLSLGPQPSAAHLISARFGHHKELPGRSGNTLF